VEAVYRILHPFDGIAMAGGLMHVQNPYRSALKIQTIRQRMEKAI